MRKTITLDLGETNKLDEFLDEYVLDEMRCALNDLDLSETTIAHMQKLLDKTKRHFISQIVEVENTDAEPVKHGKWIPHEDEYGEHDGDDCSECGERYVMPFGKLNYCPSCGARMEKENASDI